MRKNVWLVLLLAPVSALPLNEIFGMPPLMTPRLDASGFAGEWRHGDIRFTIASDGSVTGAVGQRPVDHARLTRNRSWFGRYMNWRTEYIIIGELSGGTRFTAPLNATDGVLEGAVFVDKRPSRVSLVRR